MEKHPVGGNFIVCKYIDKGEPIVIIGGQMSLGETLYALPERADEFKELNDETLDGKKIGVTRLNTGDIVFRKILKDRGVDLSKIQIVELDSQQTVTQAVLKGEVDLGINFLSYRASAEQAGLVPVSQLDADDEWPGYICCRLFTTKDKLKANRDVYVRAVKANIRAYELYVTDHDKTIEEALKGFNIDKDVLEDQLYSYGHLGLSPNPDVKNTSKFYEAMTDVGYANGDADISEHIDASVYIDALPIAEETGASYSSQNKNVMHACGHDNHMAMLLGAAKILSDHKDELNGTVRLLFQSAEESCYGAKYYVEHGLLDDVDAIYGCHVWDSLESMKINIESGPRMSSCDNFTITVKGRAAHGSAPNRGVDAIVTAAEMILQIQTIVSRKSDPRDSLVITIGEISGGPRFNIISDHVELKGTVRTHSAEVRNKVKDWILNVIENVARANDAGVKLEYNYCPGVLINDEGLTKIAQNSVRTLFGEDTLAEQPAAMGSEDFSFFLDKVPGVYAFIGSHNEEKGTIYPNHNSHFNIDEGILKRGAALYAQFAYDYLEKS